MATDLSDVSLFDLPPEILLIILQKLNNIDVLYSLFNVDSQQLDLLLRDKAFTTTFNFVLPIRLGVALPVGDSILNRYCLDILPKIDSNITCLILESKTMERILVAAQYPHLSELKVYNVEDSIVSEYFTVRSPFRCLFQKQFTTLTLVYHDDIDRLSAELNTDFAYEYIFKLFTNVKDLSIRNAPRALSMKYLSLDTCLSSSLTTLCLHMYRFEDCFALLDGRLKYLTKLTVSLNYFEYRSSAAKHINQLPNMKSFSLTCYCPSSEFDTYGTPLLCSISNLEELTLEITNYNRKLFVDGTELHEKVLVHMPQLSKFTFYIRTTTEVKYLVNNLSEKDIQRSFINIGYEQVRCFFDEIDSSTSVRCHVFSLPFGFDCFPSIGNSFPCIIFSNVTHLYVHDRLPFKHEFFLRVARCFSYLQYLSILNYVSGLLMSSN